MSRILSRVWKVISDYAFKLHPSYQPPSGSDPFGYAVASETRNGGNAVNNNANSPNRRPPARNGLDVLINYPKQFLSYLIFEMTVGLICNMSVSIVFFAHVLPNVNFYYTVQSKFNAIWLCILSVLNTLGIIPKLLSLIKLHSLKRSAVQDPLVLLSRNLWVFIRCNVYTVNNFISRAILITYMWGTWVLFGMFFGLKAPVTVSKEEKSVSFEKPQCPVRKGLDRLRDDPEDNYGRSEFMESIREKVLNSEFLSQLLVIVFMVRLGISFFRFWFTFGRQNIEEDFESFKGLTQHEINSLPLKQLEARDVNPTQDEGSSSDMCIICLEQYQPGHCVRQMMCHEKHVFHQHCVDKWLMRSRQCPICRTDLFNMHQGFHKNLM